MGSRFNKAIKRNINYKNFNGHSSRMLLRFCGPAVNFWVPLDAAVSKPTASQKPDKLLQGSSEASISTCNVTIYIYKMPIYIYISGSYLSGFHLHFLTTEDLKVASPCGGLLDPPDIAC